MAITADDMLNGIMGMTAEEVLKAFEEFLLSVEADGYQIVPSKSAFADYIGQPRADVHEWCRIHPTEDDQMKRMCADTLASGALLKKYVSNVANFALKNWCGWEEAPQKKSQTSKTAAAEENASKLLDEYIAGEKRKKLRVAV